MKNNQTNKPEKKKKIGENLLAHFIAFELQDEVFSSMFNMFNIIYVCTKKNPENIDFLHLHPHPLKSTPW